MKYSDEFLPAVYVLNLVKKDNGIAFALIEFKI